MNETVTTITIKTNNGEITDFVATPIAETPVEIKPHKKRHKTQDNYSVYDEALLNKIACAGLLGMLHGVHIANDKKKSWYFDRVPEVKAIIDAYLGNKNIESEEK